MSRSNGNDISRTISEFMRECIDENEEALLERSKSAAKSAVKALRQESRKRSGAYAKDWASKVESGETGVEATVYNRKHYQLTHLLENGHAKVNGGRTRAYPHIAPAEEFAERQLEQLLQRKLGGSQ